MKASTIILNFFGCVYDLFKIYLIPFSRMNFFKTFLLFLFFSGTNYIGTSPTKVTRIRKTWRQSKKRGKIWGTTNLKPLRITLFLKVKE